MFHKHGILKIASMGLPFLLSLQCGNGDETRHVKSILNAKWSPGNNYISFLKQEYSYVWRSNSGCGTDIHTDEPAPPRGYDLYLMNPARTLEKKLAAGFLFPDDNYEWSPHGNEIVFARRLGPSYFRILGTIDTSGQMTGIDTAAAVFGFDWSPDASGIVYSAQQSYLDTVRLYIAPGTGAPPHLVSDSLPGNVSAVSWSINNQIAFEVAKGSKVYLGTIGADGSGYKILDTLDFTYPTIDWSPDGNYLIYIDVEDTTLGAQIFLHDFNSDRKRQVTHYTSPTSFISIRFSPDGSKIGYSTGGGLSVVQPDGSGRRQIASTSSPVEPSWSADATRLVYADKDSVIILQVQ
jgi:Tol biopolymer transport system component